MTTVPCASGADQPPRCGQPFLFTGQELRRDWQFGALEPSSFDLIMADPPWRFETYSALGLEKSPDAHYGTMSAADIKRLPVAELAAGDCLLWLWSTWPLLPLALECVAAWGFTFKTGGAWAKRTRHGKAAFGTGYLMRSASEPFLIATRGAPRVSRSVRNLIDGEARQHSRKPEAAYAAAEKLMPRAMRVELFSRCEREGWSVWGDEVGKFAGSALAPERQGNNGRTS